MTGQAVVAGDTADARGTSDTGHWPAAWFQEQYHSEGYHTEAVKQLTVGLIQRANTLQESGRS